MATALKTATKKTTSKTSSKKPNFDSRAVLRLVQPGSWIDCVACGEQVKFRAREQFKQMICNVYENGVWQRVEHFHEGCYHEAGDPYGEAVD